MEALTLFAMCFVGTAILPAQPEATAIFYASELGWHPIAVGLVAGAGQCGTYMVAYVGGEQLLRRWKFLDRQVTRVRDRFAAHLERNYLVTSALSGSVGLPPALALSAVASGFRVPLTHFMAVLYAARVVRISLIAAFGTQLAAWWRATSF